MGEALVHPWPSVNAICPGLNPAGQVHHDLLEELAAHPNLRTTQGLAESPVVRLLGRFGTMAASHLRTAPKGNLRLGQPAAARHLASDRRTPTEHQLLILPLHATLPIRGILHLHLERGQIFF